MGREAEIERETLNKCKVSFCLGVDASHSTRNDIWITLTIRLWFPIPFRAQVETLGIWLPHHHSISSTSTLVRSAQEPNTPCPASPFTRIFLWTILSLISFRILALLLTHGLKKEYWHFFHSSLLPWIIFLPLLFTLPFENPRWTLEPFPSHTHCCLLLFAVTLAPVLTFYFQSSPYLMPITLLIH